MSPAIANGSITSAVAAMLVRTGPSRSRVPRSINGRRRASLVPDLELLQVTNQNHAVTRRQPEQRQECQHRSERELGSVDEGRQHSADQRDRQCQECQYRQAPAAEGRLQEQEDGDRGGPSKGQHSPAVDLLTGRALKHLGVVLEREAHVREPALDVAGDRFEAAPADVGLERPGNARPPHA